jgi:hypothetical protein
MLKYLFSAHTGIGNQLMGFKGIWLRPCKNIVHGPKYWEYPALLQDTLVHLSMHIREVRKRAKLLTFQGGKYKPRWLGAIIFPV